MTTEEKQQDLFNYLLDKQENLFDYLLGKEIDEIGLLQTISNMIDRFEFTKDELIDLGFEETDIDQAIDK